MTDALARLSAATLALAEAKTLEDVKQIHDMAQAAQVYARAAKLGLEAQNHAAEVKLRAERKAGELLRELEREQGGSGRFGSSNNGQTGLGNVAQTVSEYRAVLDETGTTRQDANRWQKIAEIPEPVFEQHLEEVKSAGRELTTTSTVQLAARLKQPEPAVTPVIPSGRYRCIVIDPPWPIAKIERTERPYQGDALDYPVMTLEEIAALPIDDMAEDAAHLYLWVTHKYLPDGLSLVNGWGFDYQCLLTWVKPVGFTPFSWMYNTEHVIYAHRGGLRLDRLGLKLSFDAPVNGHSVKPERFYDLVRQVSPGPRLEMFARQERIGFDAWGNEARKAGQVNDV